MLWHRQAIFKSKGDKLCSSAECTYTHNKLNTATHTFYHVQRCLTCIHSPCKNLMSKLIFWMPRGIYTPQFCTLWRCVFSVLIHRCAPRDLCKGVAPRLHRGHPYAGAWWNFAAIASITSDKPQCSQQYSTSTHNRQPKALVSLCEKDTNI